MIVIRSVRIYLARSAKGVARGPDAHLDGLVAVWEEWKVVRKQAQAPETWIRMKLQLLHTNLVKSAPTSNRPTLSRLSHPKMILTRTLKILLH